MTMVAEENNKVVLAEERMCSMTLDDLIKMSKIKSRSKKRMCSMTLDDLIKMSNIKQEAAPNRVSIPTRWGCNDAAAAQEDRVIRHQRRFRGQKRTTPIPIQIDRVSVFDRISRGPCFNNTSYDTRGSVFDRIISCGDTYSIEPEPVNGGASYYYDQAQAPTQTTTLDSLFATIKAQRMMKRRIPNNSFGIGELRGRGN